MIKDRKRHNYAIDKDRAAEIIARISAPELKDLSSAEQARRIGTKDFHVRHAKRLLGWGTAAADRVAEHSSAGDIQIMSTDAPAARSEPLTPDQNTRLQELENLIGRGLRTFYEVGTALLEINEHRLYRATHDSFDAYTRDRWSMTRTHAHRLMFAASTTAAIEAEMLPIGDTAGGDGTVLPANESQVRPLIELPTEEQVAAWKEAVATAPDKKLTAAHVQKVVDRRTGKETNGAAPNGKSRVNGVVTDDPPDVARARADGKIGADVVPEVTETGTAQHPEASRDPGQDDPETADEWLETLPAYKKLTGTRRDLFAADALIYRDLDEHRKTFAYHAARTIKASKRKGEYAYRTSRYIKTDHPKDWLVCPPTEAGGCGGSGEVEVIGKCPKCFGRGYRING